MADQHLDSCAGNPNTCNGGFVNFPTFGLPGLASSLYGWNFNFELTYPGIGMLVSVQPASLYLTLSICH